MNTTKKDTAEDKPQLPGDENAAEVTKAFQAFVMEPLQKVTKRLEGLEAESAHRDDRISEFEERIKALETKFDELSAHLKQAAPQPDPAKADEAIVLAEPVLDTRELIARVMAEASQNLKADQTTIDLHLTNAGFWLDRGKKLEPLIKAAAGAADEIIANSSRILENLPAEIAKALGNSQQGLNIIGRMLQRLIHQDDRLESLLEDLEFADDLKEPAEDEWVQLLEGEKDESAAQQKINKQLGSIKKSNYNLVSQAGELADKRQKRWLDFIGQQVLPILDGIIDGKNHTAALIEELREQSQDSDAELSQWFDTYATLSSTLVTMLDDLGICRMDIAPGMMIDFERHEPSSVEADPEMDNEQIKEISRDGYEYIAPNGDRQTLRVARVVAIKNNDS
jgi:molecular chaperone GrpE (heat shock protein)